MALGVLGVPAEVVGDEVELGIFLRDGELRELFLFGDMVSEGESFIVGAEDEIELARGVFLGEMKSELVVVVADGVVFAGEGCPALVGGGGFGLGDLKAGGEIGIAF